MTASRNFPAVFAAATAAARPLPTSASRVVASDSLVEFIEACDTAIGLVLPAPAELLPGVDVEQPAAMLMAYLLFLVNKGVHADCDAVDGARVKDWYERVSARVWERVGFRRTPSLLQVQLAFSLLGESQHLAAELRALVWAVGDFAATGLLPGLRT